jgi:hypothetical protein
MIFFQMQAPTVQVFRFDVLLGTKHLILVQINHNY